MSENKNIPTQANPLDFINAVEDPKRKADAITLLALFAEISGEPAVMWGDSIIGFGQYHYKYASGREGDYIKGGFAPRKSNIAIYLISGSTSRPDLLAKLGPHKTGASCLYITRLEKIDMGVLRELIKDNFETMTAKYG